MTQAKKQEKVSDGRPVYTRITVSAFETLAKIAKQESDHAFMKVTISDIVRRALRDYIGRYK